MKKQALKGVNELIGYYSKKYKKVTSTHNKGAHVIGHYADGAKVIGLTDAELYKQLKRMNNLSNKESSPYAANDYRLGFSTSVYATLRPKIASSIYYFRLQVPAETIRLFLVTRRL